MKIYYVGKKARKRDNLLKKSRVWNGRGSSVEVPDDEADNYLAFPEIWSTTAPDDALTTAEDLGDDDQDSGDDDDENLEETEEEKAARLDSENNAALEREQAILVAYAELKDEGNKNPGLKKLTAKCGFNVSTEDKARAKEQLAEHLAAADEAE